jgi:pimeloyl-ACP methyl ester carboxylesterase
MIPGGLFAPYVRGGAASKSLKVANVKAVVGISPAGGALKSWGTEGLRAITAPLLLISGDRDQTVDYASGARAFFRHGDALEPVSPHVQRRRTPDRARSGAR